LARQYDRETEEAIKIRDSWRQEDENKRLDDQKEWERMKSEAHERVNQRAQREAAHKRETDAWKAQRDSEQAAEETRQAREQRDLDELVERYRREKQQDLDDFARLQDEKNRELDELRRERDALRRESEDIDNQIQALRKIMDEEARTNAKVESNLQQQCDQLNDQYQQRQIEIENELEALRQKYAQLIAEEQERLDELTPEVEAILSHKKINDDARLSIEQFQREREQRRKSLKQKEQAKITKKKTLQNEAKNEHYVDRGISQNFTESELEGQCDKLFSTAPIFFRPKNIPLEQAMHEVYTQQNIVIPIIHIREKLYLIGSGRMTCDFRSDTAMVKVGGGYERFEDYVSKNERYHQKKLVTYMINNQASLEWVVGQLIEGKNI
jgi:hypothetical protein